MRATISPRREEGLRGSTVTDDGAARFLAMTSSTQRCALLSLAAVPGSCGNDPPQPAGASSFRVHLPLRVLRANGFTEVVNITGGWVSIALVPGIRIET